MCFASHFPLRYLARVFMRYGSDAVLPTVRSSIGTPAALASASIVRASTSLPLIASPSAPSPSRLPPPLSRALGTGFFRLPVRLGLGFSLGDFLLRRIVSRHAAPR